MPAHRKELKIEGANLWYLVGLIASDGNLSKDGRHIDITAKEKDFLQRIKGNLGLVNKVCAKNKGTPAQAYRIQIANKGFYEFLLSIGLTQDKSLTIGKLKVPNEYFIDFVRGVIDGDGCIRKWIHSSNKKEQWSLRIYSGSGKFIKWLKESAELLLRVQGKIYREVDALWTLKFGKMATREIVRRCYYQDCLGLERKIKLAQECYASYVGWKQSKTVLN
ncbi:MAG: LAGLIDADG family homing endonuclease [Candidatus Omnitrophota bacterium]|nr:LAGLIDADG family homing endonuclease [Candidatus Omnitrophota bacterium]